MKETIKQLEKEIEKWTYPYKDRSDKSSRVQEVYDYKKELLKAKLQTLQEVCKEIDKQIKNYQKLNKKFPKNQTFVDMWTSLFALELKLQGEENV